MSTKISDGNIKPSLVGTEKIPVSGASTPVVTIDQIKSFALDQAFKVTSTQPEAGVTWIDSGNAYAGMYPVRKYILGAWQEITPSITYYDPIGKIFSNGQPLLVVVWGQSNAFSSFNLDYLGSNNSNYATTSTTSINTATVVIGTPITITIGTGKSWKAGDYLKLKSTGTPAEFFMGEVTSYTSGSGSITFSPITAPVSASSYTDWEIIIAQVGDIKKDNKITIWDADADEWVVPDFTSQPTGGTTQNWSWNLCLGENNIQAFAKDFIKSTGRAVRIVQWRQGGTPLAYWEKGAASGSFPGWTALNNEVIASGLPPVDLVIGVHGEGGFNDATYISSYSTYQESIYKAIIPAFRYAAWGKQETAFIMPSSALGIEATGIGNSQYPADYAIRSLGDGMTQSTAWAQGLPEKQIRIPTNGEGQNTSSTSLNLATLTGNFSIVVSGTFAYSVNNPIWLVSRANENNRIKATFVSGTGTLNLTMVEKFGTGTLTDWDVLPQDYLHKTVKDNVADGIAISKAYQNLSSRKQERIFNHTGTYGYGLILNDKDFPPSDRYIEKFNTVTANSGTLLEQWFITTGSLAGTKVLVMATGGASEADVIFQNKTAGEATSSDEVGRFNYRGFVVKKPLYFGAPTGNSVVDARIEKISGPGIQIHSGWDGNLTAVINMSIGNSGNVFQLLENGGSGAQEAKFSINLNVTGNISMLSIGNGLRIKTGANARAGTATLVGGTVTVSNTTITANTMVKAFSQVDGGTPGYLRCTTKTVGTSFVITSSSASDTSTVYWELIELIP
jgi:hypothetical protein